jgi:hypothetical protein
VTTTNGKHVLDQLLDPVTQCLTPDAARSLLNLRAPAEAQARIEELADKCTAGTLTPDEEAEYDSYLWSGNLIAVLQAKARALLAEAPRV